MFTAFTEYCRRKNTRTTVIRKDFRSQLEGLIGEMIQSSNNGVRNYWFGWQLVAAPPIGEESDDEVESVTHDRVET